MVKTLALLVICANAAALQLTSGSASPDPARYTLQGTVVNSITGEPVGRALVIIHAQEQRAVLTDSQGRFQFDNLPHLETALGAQKPGFFDGQQWQHSARQPLIEVGPNTAPVVLKLIPEAVVTGHVYDENGESLERVPIKLNTFLIVNGRKQWQPKANAVTDDDGEFRIANLLRGEYYMTAGPSGNRSLLPSGSPEQPAYPVVYYPDAPDVTSAAPIDLIPGQHAQLDFSLKPAHAFTLSGRVSGFSSGQYVNLTFLNQSGEEMSVGNNFNPQTGTFEARIAYGGICTIHARAQDAAQNTLVAETTVNLVASIKNVNLTLVPTATVPVIVQQTKLAFGSSSGAGYIFSGLQSGNNLPISIYLTSLDRANLGRQNFGITQGGPQNNITIEHLEPGAYHVEANAYYPWYVHSMTVGTSDLLREPFVVTQGGARAIQIELRDDSATLTGTMNGEQKNGTVLIVPERAPLYPRTSLSNNRGEFQLSGLAPGDYKVFAFDSVEGLEYMNPDVLRLYSSKAAQVTLLPEQKSTVSLDLIRTQE